MHTHWRKTFYFNKKKLVPLFPRIVLVLIWISWFHVWIFILFRIKINLGYWHTHTHKIEQQNTRFVNHSFTKYTCISGYIYLWVFVYHSIFIRVVCLCAWNIYSPKLQRMKQKMFHRDKMANFISENQNWTASHRASAVNSFFFNRNFYLRILWNCALFLAWNVFPCDVPFYLFFM